MTYLLLWHGWALCLCVAALMRAIFDWHTSGTRNLLLGFCHVEGNGMTAKHTRCSTLVAMPTICTYNIVEWTNDLQQVRRQCTIRLSILRFIIATAFLLVLLASIAGRSTGLCKLHEHIETLNKQTTAIGAVVDTNID